MNCISVFMKELFLTIRPASLLCLFMADRASGRFSRASANSRDTRTPNSASSLQPPHFHPSPGGPLWCESQPHIVDVPSAHDRVTANATPADAMAWTNADSLVARKKRTINSIPWSIYILTVTPLGRQHQIWLPFKIFLPKSMAHIL